MGNFKFLNLFSLKEGAGKPEADTVALWEDDYLQVEILPSENLAFLKEQLKIASEFGEAHRTEEGFFTGIFVRKGEPFPTIEKEFRADTLAEVLSSDGLLQYKTIEYYEGTEPRVPNGKTKAFGFEGFALFFETSDEFVTNIWAVVKQGITPAQSKVIVSALYYLGETYDLILVDWNTDELVGLTDMRKISAYLI